MGGHPRKQPLEEYNDNTEVPALQVLFGEEQGLGKISSSYYRSYPTEKHFAANCPDPVFSSVLARVCESNKNLSKDPDQLTSSADR